MRFACLLTLAIAFPLTSSAAVWVTGPSHQVARPEKAPAASEIWNAQGRTVNLSCARNEFVSFQIVFSGAAKGVNVEQFALKGPQGQTLSGVELLREHFMLCKVISQYDAANRPPDVSALDKKYSQNNWPREFPDQLVPLSAGKYGAPFDVEEGKNEVVWADIFVPEDAAPGEYTASFKAGGETINVKLTVWNFTLPSVSHFPYWAHGNPEEISWGFGKRHTKIPQMMDIWDAYFQMAHNHRLSLMETWENDLAYVKSDDRRFHSYITGSAFKGPFGKGFGQEVLAISSGAFKNFADLVKSEGWYNRAFVYLIDEPNDKNAYDEVRKRGAAVKAATDGKFMRMVTEQYDPQNVAWGKLDDGVDIFCSGGTPVSQIPEIEKKGKVVWTYNAGHAGAPNTDAPGVACRTHAWAGFVSGSRVWFYWEAIYYVDKQMRLNPAQRRQLYAAEDPTQYLSDLWNDPLVFDETRRNNGRYPARDAIRLNGEGILVYPGKDVGVNGPIASMRLKNIRQGATDFEYLYLLEKLGKRDLADAEAKKLLGQLAAGGHSADGQQSGGARFSNYDADGGHWDAARIRLGKALSEIGEKAIREKVTPWNAYPNPTGSPDFYGGKRY